MPARVRCIEWGGSVRGVGARRVVNAAVHLALVNESQCSMLQNDGRCCALHCNHAVGSAAPVGCVWIGSVRPLPTTGQGVAHGASCHARHRRPSQHYIPPRVPPLQQRAAAALFCLHLLHRGHNTRRYIRLYGFRDLRHGALTVTSVLSEQLLLRAHPQRLPVGIHHSYSHRIRVDDLTLDCGARAASQHRLPCCISFLRAAVSVSAVGSASVRATQCSTQASRDVSLTSTRQ